MRRHIDRLQDELLILEFRAGDAGALEKLVSRWQKRIYWFILTLVQDDSAVWDVSQEVWMAAVKGLRKRKLIPNFPAWLYGIAHHKAVSHLRKNRRLDKHEDVFAENIKGLHVEGPDPIETAENARFVQECLQELPFAQREALTLFYLNDLALDEIARVLEVPLGTVQSRLHYGRLKMKEFLVKKGFGDEE